MGELKKGRYIYYHCTGYKGKCPEPYIREEIFDERFAELLKGLSLDGEILEWVTAVLRPEQLYGEILKYEFLPFSPWRRLLHEGVTNTKIRESGEVAVYCP